MKPLRRKNYLIIGRENGKAVARFICTLFCDNNDNFSILVLRYVWVSTKYDRDSVFRAAYDYAMHNILSTHGEYIPRQVATNIPAVALRTLDWEHKQTNGEVE